MIGESLVTTWCLNGKMVCTNRGNCEYIELTVPDSQKRVVQLVLWAVWITACLCKYKQVTKQYTGHWT